MARAGRRERADGWALQCGSVRMAYADKRERAVGAYENVGVCGRAGALGCADARAARTGVEATRICGTISGLSG